MAISATELRAGRKILHNDDIYVVLKIQHRTPGKGNAVMQTVLRSLTTGKSTEVRFNSTEKVETATLEYKQMQFMYKDDDGYNFMDNDTFEQVAVSAEELGDAANFLVDNMEVTVQYYKGKAIGVDIPNFVELEIVDTEPGLKGDTVSNTFKPAKVSTGVSVEVPLFLNQGDVIRIDTRTGEYVTRVSKA